MKNKIDYLALAHTQNIIFPRGIKKIPPKIFRNNSTIREIFIPATIIKIGRNAFENCCSLTKITIYGNKKTSIGPNAFKHCKNLITVNLIDVPYIEESAFENCENLKHLSIEGTTIIFKNAFKNCTALTMLPIPSTIHMISDYAFYNTGIKSINFPDSLEILGKNVFPKVSIENFCIKPGFVDNCAFSGTIQNVYFYESNFGERWNGGIHIPHNGILSKCIITNLHTPVDLNLFEEAALSHAKLIHTINISEGTTSIPSYAFAYCPMETVTLPDSIEYIGNRAFEYCDLLKEVIIPKSVKEIRNFAFTNCAGLQKVTIYGHPKIAKNAFKNCPYGLVIEHI